MFRPINNHIEVEPIEEESIIASHGNNFEEKGIVKSVCIGHQQDLSRGDVVFFDSWMIARYPDAEGKMRYLVPFDAIRAIETDDKKLLTRSDI